MIGMELSAMVLLFADRYAYIYRSQADPFGFFMTRISNFLVFSMIIAVLISVNQYIKDICIHDVGLNKVPKLLM